MKSTIFTYIFGILFCVEAHLLKAKAADIQSELMFFWTSGLKASERHLAENEEERIFIGGKRIAEQFQTYLAEAVQANIENLNYRVRFILDPLTYDTNPWLQQLAHTHPQKLTIEWVEDVTKRYIHLLKQENKEEYSETVETLMHHAEGGNPAIASDGARLLFSAVSEQIPQEESDERYFVYLDIDTFVGNWRSDSVRNKEKRGSGLERLKKILECPQEEEEFRWFMKGPPCHHEDEEYTSTEESEAAPGQCFFQRALDNDFMGFYVRGLKGFSLLKKNSFEILDHFLKRPIKRERKEESRLVLAKKSLDFYQKLRGLSESIKELVAEQVDLKINLVPDLLSASNFIPSFKYQKEKEREDAGVKDPQFIRRIPVIQSVEGERTWGTSIRTVTACESESVEAFREILTFIKPLGKKHPIRHTLHDYLQHTLPLFKKEWISKFKEASSKKGPEFQKILSEQRAVFSLLKDFYQSLDRIFTPEIAREIWKRECV